jgi:hypothetical protein
MVNRDDVIAYLLNEMPEAERAAFAERWFTEPELYERLRMSEAALLDDYVRGKLSRRERRQVEQFLLGSDVQRDKLKFAETLRVIFAQSARARVPWLYIAAAVLLVSLGLTFWLGLENRSLHREVARLEAGAHLEHGGVYTLGIPADTLRGASEEARVQLPTDVSLLRLELELKPGDEASPYSVTVFRDSKIVWSEGPLRPTAQGADQIAITWIPAGVLAQGDYTVQLAASGNPIANYRFAVTR